MLWNCNRHLGPCSSYTVSDTCIETCNLGASSPQVISVLDCGKITEPLSGLNCPLEMHNSLHQLKIYFLTFLNSLKAKWLTAGSRSLALVINTAQSLRRMMKELWKEGKWRRRSGTEVRSPLANIKWVCWKKTGLWISMAVMWALTKNCHTI